VCLQGAEGAAVTLYGSAAPPTPKIEVDLCSHLSQKKTHTRVAAVAQQVLARLSTLLMSLQPNYSVVRGVTIYKARKTHGATVTVVVCDTVTVGIPTRVGCMRNGIPVLWYCGPRGVPHVNSSVKISKN
jgi:hypothetical protein